jgi:S-DNA-T family DNA segregation ATPase FtsK/SpoIIIE
MPETNFQHFQRAPPKDATSLTDLSSCDSVSTPTKRILSISATQCAQRIAYTEPFTAAVNSLLTFLARQKSDWALRLFFLQLTMAANTNAKKSQGHSHLLQDLLGLIFLFFAIFTVLALCSYSSSDPSFFTSANSPAKNLAGILGSQWASALWQTLGAAAFMLAFIFLLAGVALFRRISRQAWSLAGLNYLLLLVSSAACFGLSRQPLRVGGSHFSMGGFVGDLLSGFFQSYLNFAGAALLSVFLLLFALSLSTKISVRDLALHAWLLLSKAAVRVFGALFFVGAQSWGYLASGYSEARPALAEALGDGWDQFLELFRRAPKEEKAEAAETARVPEISAPAARLQIKVPPSLAEAPEEESNVIPLRKANEEEAGSACGPEIITKPGETLSLFDAPEEMNAAAGEKPKLSPFVSFVKKAVKSNEKAVKEALGKEQKFEFPPLAFLNTPIAEGTKLDRDELLRNSKVLEGKFNDFNVKGQVTAVKPGPVVTMYEFKPAAGVKVSAISNLSDDLALSLSAKSSIRIVAPIPGRDVVGIEVPNHNRESVLLKEILGADTFQSRNHSIPIAIGKDILGSPVVADLKKMPHLLVAGTTGSGKSVFINTLICSLLYKFSPNDLNLILVDPKQLELAPYNDIPHLLLPVVTEPKKASLALNWAVQEMERRYRVIAASVTRDQESYNKKLGEIGVEKMHALLNKGKAEVDEKLEAERMPKILVVIDELADLMMTAKADVENNICRLAQKARAAGIHLVLATQRPSTDVITGLIKANLPSRICFKVSSKVDSRVMFDSMGAEKLIGMGDMLFMAPGESSLVRMHGAYISVEEVDQITSFWRAQAKPAYRDDILVDPEEDLDGAAFSAEETNDPLFQQALDIAFAAGAISTSYLQRRMGIGYNKAARFVDMMEAQGVVGPANGAKPRPVINGPRP